MHDASTVYPLSILVENPRRVQAKRQYSPKCKRLRWFEMFVHI